MIINDPSMIPFYPFLAYKNRLLTCFILEPLTIFRCAGAGALQVCTLQLDASTGLLDEKDLVQRLQKIQTLNLRCNLPRAGDMWPQIWRLCALWRHSLLNCPRQFQHVISVDRCRLALACYVLQL